MPDLFKDIIHSILVTKKCVIHDETDQKDYVQFVVNRALYYQMDCILYANEMNKNFNLDKDMQYQYLLNTIRPMKRKFQPWQKQKQHNDIECVKTYFGYSNSKAKDALKILSEEQLDIIREKTIIGGNY